jgi:hypothetical protein
VYFFFFPNSPAVINDVGFLYLSRELYMNDIQEDLVVLQRIMMMLPPSFCVYVIHFRSTHAA